MNSNAAFWTALVIFLALVAGAAAFGAVFKPGAWHAALTKPSWNPPNWVFGPVWTILYVMIGVAGWLIWNKAPLSWAMGLWGVQLLLNAVWSWLFFGLHRMDLAFIDIVLLWAAIGAFIIASWPVSLTSACLFIPYFLWVSFAAALNLSIWRLNI